MITNLPHKLALLVGATLLLTASVAAPGLAQDQKKPELTAKHYGISFRNGYDKVKANGYLRKQYESVAAANCNEKSGEYFDAIRIVDQLKREKLTTYDKENDIDTYKAYGDVTRVMEGMVKGMVKVEGDVICQVFASEWFAKELRTRLKGILIRSGGQDAEAEKACKKVDELLEWAKVLKTGFGAQLSHKQRQKDPDVFGVTWNLRNAEAVEAFALTMAGRIQEKYGQRNACILGYVTGEEKE